MHDYCLNRKTVSLGRSFVETHRLLIQKPLMAMRHPVIRSGGIAGKLRDQQINQTWLHLRGLLVIDRQIHAYAASLLVRAALAP